MEENARRMHMEWNTEAGKVVFSYPSNMNEENVMDVRALLDLALQGMERRASAIEARSVETARLSPQDESAVATGEAPKP